MDSTTIEAPPPYKPNFSLLDYSLFIVSLGVSLLVGCYYGLCKSNEARTTKDVLFAGGKLGVLPVAMTLIATFMSAISFLGYPAEIYEYGSMLYYYCLVYFIAYPISAYLFLPLFYKLQLPSAYEYLSMRFNMFVRRTASIIFCFQTVMYLAVGLYAPALTLYAVMDLPLWVSILLTGFVCVVYTSIGGAKTVVWTTVWQFALIIFGLSAVIVSGIIHAGGLSNVFRIAHEGRRLDMNDFRLSPLVRHSFWSVTIGGTFIILSLYTANQMTMQRYISMKSLKEAQIAVLLNIPLNLLVVCLYALAGLIVYAAFYGCDPVRSGRVRKTAEILPYFVINYLSYGVPGLFVSAVYGAGLSTVAAGLNALSAASLEDFAKPAYRRFARRSLDDDDGRAALVSKVISFSFGLLTVLLAYLFSLVKAPILQIALSIFGIGGGPILGVFCLGIFFRRPNGLSAAIALLTSILLTSWIGFGALVYGVKPQSLPLSTDNCTNENFSSFKQSSSYTSLWYANFSDTQFTSQSNYYYSTPNYNRTIITKTNDESSLLLSAYNYKDNDDNSTSSFTFIDIYRLSYQYYCLFGFLVVIIVGNLTSFCTNRHGDRTETDPNLYISFESCRSRKTYRLPLNKTITAAAAGSAGRIGGKTAGTGRRTAQNIVLYERSSSIVTTTAKEDTSQPTSANNITSTITTTSETPEKK